MKIQPITDLFQHLDDEDLEHIASYIEERRPYSKRMTEEQHSEQVEEITDLLIKIREL